MNLKRMIGREDKVRKKSTKVRKRKRSRYQHVILSSRHNQINVIASNSYWKVSITKFSIVIGSPRAYL